ncbi:MAG: hypothetical protein N2C14_12995 [Planctomycetales bacterium]
MIHPLFFTLVFLKGGVFGSQHSFGMFSEQTVIGVRGGWNAVEFLSALYVLSVGILPLVVSGTGLGLGLDSRESG